MAASNSRDVSLRILVDTLGQDSVDKLRVALDQLGAQGEASAAEARELVNELDRLSAQGQAVQGLQSLTSELEQLQAREASAAAAIETNTTALVAQRAAVEAARAAQAGAKTSLADAQKAFIETGTAISLLNKEYDAAGKKTDDYKNSVRALIQTQGEQRAAIVDARQALRDSTNGLGEAVTAQTKLEAVQTKGVQAAQAAADAVEQQTRAFTTAQATAEALGVSTDNLAASEARLQTELTALVSVAERRAAAIREMAEADRLLAIEEATLAEQMARGAVALQAEELAQRDAARAVREYTAAKAQAVADAQAWQREAEQIVNAAHAAQELTRQTELLVTASRELAAQNAFEQQAADAQRMVKAAEYVRFWETALEGAENQVRETAAAAKLAADQIDSAFAAVGTRSVQGLQAEIAQVRAGMVTLAATGAATGSALRTAFAQGESKIRDLEREIRQLNGTMTVADQAANLLKNSLGQIAAGNIIADAVGYLVNKVKELGREFITANTQAETMRRGLTAIYGSATIAGEQLDFLRETARTAGISVGQISDSFVRFSAATKSSNIPLQTTNELFTAVTRAGATLGLSSERVTLALDALAQMASKGVVSMEELRQQLGDSLPGALSTAARGLGITDQQLIKLVESGKLATEDFFPALTKGLQNLQGENDTLAASFGRFATALNTAAVTAGDAGWLDVLKGGMTVLSGTVGVLVLALSGFMEVLFGVGKAIGVLVGAVTTLSSPVEALGKIVEDAASRQSRLTDAFFGSSTAANAQALAVQANAAVQSGTASVVLGAAAGQERLAAALGATGNAYVQQLVQLTDSAKASEVAISASEKLLKAKTDEGKAAVLTAQLTGDAAKANEAQARAAEANVVASGAVVNARLREVQVTEQAIAVINTQRDALGALSSSKQQQLDALNKTLVVQQAALEKDQQATFELDRQALAARTAAQAYGDNSTQIAAYQQAMEAATATATVLATQLEIQKNNLDQIAAGMAAGTATQEQYNAAKQAMIAATNALNAATGDAARFENLYRDAVNDSIQAVDQKSRAQEAALSVDLATVKVAQQHYEVLAREAQALGETTLAVSYRITAKQKEMEAVRLTTRIKMLELDADKAAIEIQIAALDPQDKLYAKKKQELEIRLQLIKAKQIEAGASAEVIRGIQSEITALTQSLSTRASSTNGIDRDTGSRYKNADAIDRQTQALVKQKTTSDGFATNKDGSAAGTFNNQLPVDKAFDVLQNGGAGKDFAYIQEAFQQAKNAKQLLDAMQRQSAGSVSLQAIRDTDALLAATTRAVEAGSGRKKSTEPTRTTSESSSNHTVTINTGGASRTINTASAADAAALTNLLKGLGNAAGTAA